MSSLNRLIYRIQDTEFVKTKHGLMHAHNRNTESTVNTSRHDNHFSLVPTTYQKKKRNLLGHLVILFPPISRSLSNFKRILIFCEGHKYQAKNELAKEFPASGFKRDDHPPPSTHKYEILQRLSCNFVRVGSRRRVRRPIDPFC